MRRFIARLLFLLFLGACCGMFAAADSRADWLDGVRERAEGGDPFAQTTLGVCYELGENLKADPAQAVSWYRKAAAKGWPGALLRLGRCHALGLGIEKDPARAVELWQKAVASPAMPGSVEETSVQEARAALARAFRLGEGTPKNIQTALQLAAPAAEWGLPDAEYELGMAYLAHGPQRDEARALHWLRRAAAAGSAPAAEALKRTEQDHQHRRTQTGRN